MWLHVCMLAMASHIQRIITRTIPNKIQSGTFGSMYFLVTLCFSYVSGVSGHSSRIDLKYHA